MVVEVDMVENKVYVVVVVNKLLNTSKCNCVPRGQILGFLA